MLSLAEIKENTKAVIQKLIERGVLDAEVVVEHILSTDEARKKVQVASESLASTLKREAKNIGRLLVEQLHEEVALLKEQVAVQKVTYRDMLAKLREYENSLRRLLVELPNLHEDDVPVGKDAQDNRVVATWFPKKSIVAKRGHWDLVERYGLVNFELGSKITGAGFPVYEGAGAKLQRALISFFLDKACEKGYEEKGLPLMVNKDSAFGTGQLPDKGEMMYELRETGMYLIPTAEVPLTNLYRDCLLAERELPVKLVSHTACFRREAGSWGRDVRGLNRLHQFDKVEIVQITKPEEARAALQQMCDHVGMLLQALGLPYRILQLCAGDLGTTAAVTYDFEVWAAGQQQWLEVSSVSSFSAYQARRMNLRYKREEGEKDYCHTLNGSALALPRVMAALLENNQAPSRIAIPAVLHDYTGFSKITKESL